MINPAEMKLIQIEVTNACNHRCCHCSRLVGHHAKPFTMSLDDIENGLQTLVDYPGHVGIMGGEPTLHPEFPKICELMKKYVPVKARRELWTAGYKWKEYKDIIHDTFYPELIAYNEHWEEQPCWHQPLQIAADEVFNGNVTGQLETDQELMWRVIDNCWIQKRWSASITPYGAYFCEVAAARAIMMGGTPPGVKVRKDWWKEPLQTYSAIIGPLCKKCSACLPMPMRNNDKQEYDDVSPENLKILKCVNSPKCKKGNCKVANLAEIRQFYKGHPFIPQTNYFLRGGFEDFPDWTPWNYRLSKEHGPKEKQNETDTKKTDAL